MSVRGFAVVMVSLLAIPGAAADWLQEGHDAARTGGTTGTLPGWNDLAFTVQLPNPSGTERAAMNPVVVGSRVFVAVPGTLCHPSQTCPLTPGGELPGSVIYAVDLATALPTEFARFDWPLYHLASDGERLYAGGDNRVTAWDLADGRPLWDAFVYGPAQEAQAPLPQVASLQSCGKPAVADGVVYVACWSQTWVGAQEVVIGAFDGATGRPEGPNGWTSSQAQPPVQSCEPTADPEETAACYQDLINTNAFSATAAYWGPAPTLSVIGDWIYIPVSQRQKSQGTFAGGWTMYAVPRAGAGTASFGNASFILYEGLDGDVEGDLGGRGGFFIPAPTGNEQALFAKGYNLMRFDATAPRPRAYDELEFRPSYREVEPGSGFALVSERLWVASATQIFLFDTELGPDENFVPFILPGGETWDEGGLVVTGEGLLARATRLDSAGYATDTILYSIHARTGAFQWRHALPSHAEVALSNDLVVAVDRTGLMHVFGRSPLGIQPRLEASYEYPGVGDLIRVDLARSAPGMHGPPVEYKAVWGDGAESDWQASPAFEHKYTQVADATARFLMRNEGKNQTASETMTFHVGQAPPFGLSTLVHPAYQNYTLFVLGLLGTLLVGLVGLYRAGRKRRRFRNELRVLETDYARLHESDARACDAMLSRRKSAARALFLEKRIEEAHASFLERRVDELRRGLRLGTIEDQLKFLPYGMVAQLQRLLTDARIDTWERSHFLEALDRQKDLTAAQRAKARKLIDEWFARDAPTT